MGKNNEIIMKRKENTVYVATLSGGKDSTVMCDLLLKNKYPVDEVIFSDTLREFDKMYKYINKVNEYFKARYKKEITILKPKKTFEDWVFGKISKNGSAHIGMIRGLPSKFGMCYWRRESKVYPMERYLKKKYPNKQIIFYIGYALGENRNVQDTEKFKYIYPLRDIFKITEEDCKAYLINQEMENPLYKHFSRTGCAMCPFQSDKSWFNVWKYYPSEWNYIKSIEKKLQLLDKDGEIIANKHWFLGYKTTEDMEKEFKLKDSQGNLFDFSDEPVKDCFCKV